MDALDLHARCATIDLLILDVDGVLTDGGIIYSDNGAELKQFHVRDGSGLKIWQFVGKRAALITGRQSKVVEVRAAELGIDPVIQGATDKMPAYRDLLAGGRLADRTGLLHRRRRAGPADPAAVRPGGGGGRCLPRGAGRGPLRDPGPGAGAVPSARSSS